MYNVILAILFFLLSPGVLLTLPSGSKGIWMSRQTSIAAAATHSFVFVVVLTLVKKYLWEIEGFSTSTKLAKNKRCMVGNVCQSGTCTGATGSTAGKCA